MTLASSRTLPGQLIGHEFFPGVVGDGQKFLLSLGGAALQEIIGQCRDIFFALAQRRQCQGNDIQPVKKIGAKSPAHHRAFEIAIGGGDDAQIGSDR